MQTKLKEKERGAKPVAYFRAFSPALFNLVAIATSPGNLHRQTAAATNKVCRLANWRTGEGKFPSWAAIWWPFKAIFQRCLPVASFSASAIASATAKTAKDQKRFAVFPAAPALRLPLRLFRRSFVVRSQQLPALSTFRCHSVSKPFSVCLFMIYVVSPRSFHNLSGLQRPEEGKNRGKTHHLSVNAVSSSCYGVNLSLENKQGEKIEKKTAGKTSVEHAKVEVICLETLWVFLPLLFLVPRSPFPVPLTFSSLTSISICLANYFKRT